MSMLSDGFDETRVLGRKYPAGEVIYRQGEMASCLYVIQKGRVELVMITGDGEDQMAVLDAGQIFGEIALFTADKRRLLTARTLEESHLISVEERIFIQRLHQDPSMAFRVLRHMAQRIYNLHKEREQWIRIKKACGLTNQALSTPKDNDSLMGVGLEKLLNVFDFSVGYHVLIVEDDPDFRRLMELWLPSAAVVRDNPLKPPSFALSQAETLSEGLAMLQQEKFDLILLDLNLPDSQGIASLERIVDQTCDTPVVVFSADADETHAVQAVHMGAQDYLVKGMVTKTQFLRAIRFALERHRLCRGGEQEEFMERQGERGKSGRDEGEGALKGWIQRWFTPGDGKNHE